jgi:hypothetical protein
MVGEEASRHVRDVVSLFMHIHQPAPDEKEVAAALISPG